MPDLRVPSGNSLGDALLSRLGQRLASSGLEIRDAGSRNDFHEEFLFGLYAESRADELAGLGWSSSQIQNFFTMQFQIRQRAYAAQFPGARDFLLLKGGSSIGRFLVWQEDFDTLRIVDIAIKGEWQNQGFGSAWIRAVQRAVSTGQVKLSVSATNQDAHRLYQRLGFWETARDSMNISMAWHGR